MTSSKNNAGSVATNDLETKNMGDTVAIIEANHINAGHYLLRMSVPKANWMATKKFDTCLKLDFYMSYHFVNNTPSENVIDVLSIQPSVV